MDKAQREWAIIERMMVGDYSKDQPRDENGRWTDKLISLGDIDLDKISSAFPNVRRSKVVITKERLQHLIERHPEDLELFERYGKTVIAEPKAILRDKKNSNTIVLIKDIPNSNLEAVVRLSMAGEPEYKENTILSFHRLREKNAKKLIDSSEIIYIQ